MINEPDWDRHPHRHPPPDDNHEADVPPIPFVPILCTIFAVYFAFVLAYKINYQHPAISITNVDISDYTLSTHHKTISCSFNINATITNPTRSKFSYSRGSVQILYHRHQVHYMGIPGGEVDGRSTWPMEMTLYFKSFPITVDKNIPITKQAIEFEAEVKIEDGVNNGRRVKSEAACRVSINVSDGSVLFINAEKDMARYGAL